MFYGSDTVRTLKCLLSELLFGNIGAAIPTYVRNVNSTVAYQVDSSGTVTNGERLNGFIESNREELERNNSHIVGYFPGGLNTSDGLTKAMSIDSLRSLFNKNSFRIVTEIQKGEIRRNCPCRNTILFILKQFRVGRICTLTCDERRARVEVHIGKER